MEVCVCKCVRVYVSVCVSENLCLRVSPFIQFNAGETLDVEDAKVDFSSTYFIVYILFIYGHNSTIFTLDSVKCVGLKLMTHLYLPHCFLEFSISVVLSYPLFSSLLIPSLFHRVSLYFSSFPSFQI